MNTLEHKYFGKLSFDNANEIGIVWKGEVDGIDVTMWYENIKANTKKATEALIETLKEDREYMDFHLEECKDAKLPDDVVEFVSQMTATAIDLWIGDSEYRITMDFMILPDESDQILCVTFNERGEISAVDWES